MSDAKRVTIVEYSADPEVSAGDFEFSLQSLNSDEVFSEVFADSKINTGVGAQNLSSSIDTPVLEDLARFDQVTMATPSTESLITAARNYGDVIPKFDGNPSSLEVFINRVDKFFAKYGSTVDETLNDYSFCLIISKLTGPAESFASTRPDLNNWGDLKNALRTKFGDHTDRFTLSHIFKYLAINARENLTDFIERIKLVQTQLNMKIYSDNALTAQQKAAHIEINEQTALEVLFNNCSPLLQTILEVRNFRTLSEATPTVINFMSKHANKEPSNNINKFSNYINKPPIIASNRQFSVRAAGSSSNNFPPAYFPPKTAETASPVFRQPVREQTSQQNLRSHTRHNNQPFAPRQGQASFSGINRTAPKFNGPPRPPNFQNPQFRQWRDPQVHLNEIETTFENEPAINDDESQYYPDLSDDTSFKDYQNFEQCENFRIPASEPNL